MLAPPCVDPAHFRPLLGGYEFFVPGVFHLRWISNLRGRSWSRYPSWSGSCRVGACCTWLCPLAIQAA